MPYQTIVGQAPSRTVKRPVCAVRGTERNVCFGRPRSRDPNTKCRRVRYHPFLNFLGLAVAADAPFSTRSTVFELSS